MSNTWRTTGDPFVIDSGIPGPIVALFAGIHGDEKPGLEALDRIIAGETRLDLLRGQLILVYANPLAIERNVRFVDENLNRLFLPHRLQEEATTSEQQRVQLLFPILDSADVLIDLHASYTPGSQPFIICERNALPIVQQLPIPTVCFGFDAAHPGGTDSYMNLLGKIGICIECGYLDDTKGADVALHSCMRALQYLRMIEPSTENRIDQQYYQAVLQYHTKTDRFRLTHQLDDFAALPAATIIGTDGDEPVSFERPYNVLFARDRDYIGEEAFVLLEHVQP